MATMASPGARRARAAGWLELAGLALLAYVPALLSSRGRVSADSKQYLYLDPAAFLSRAPNMWDAQVAAGGLSHQHIGYLWPMGPWFWALDALGVPPWVAQRLWLGTVGLAAALGTRWLLRRLGLRRVGVLAGTLVYLLAPYQLAFTARASVLLLPWAGLPWLVGLTDRAEREGGWRDPAWIALIVLTIGAVNASSLLLVAIGPIIWLLVGMTDRTRARRAAAVAGRVAVLATAVSLWWIAALRLEDGYGLPVLQVTENVKTVAEFSTPSDVLRGLGNWFFYGRDRLGYSIDQAAAYLDDGITVAATFAMAALGVAAAIAVRWRHRSRFVALVLVGTVVSVGAWPLDDPSPFARGVAELTGTSAGLALRNTARAVPVVLLGLAGLLAAAVSAINPSPRRWAAAGLVSAVALCGMRPVALTGMLSERVDRVDPVPQAWRDAAADLDAAGTDTRVLEIPGSNFAAHRWGNTVDPVLPGMMERGDLFREVLPQGSASSVLLLDALDRRIQEGTLEPAALAPVARLFGVGDILLRSDLEYERYRTPNPRALWQQLTEAAVPGLDAPIGYGEPVRNQAAPSLPMLDEVELRSSSVEPPPVAVFGVDDPQSIVRVASAQTPIVVAGDADGIVDAAAGGLIDGRRLVLQATSLTNAALDQAVESGADLVITDTYRRRIQTWFYAIRDTRGPTERAGETLPEPSGYDYRIDPTPHVGDERRTVVEPIGGIATATDGGGASRPEDRAAAGVDGDVRTAWRVGGADPRGTRWHLAVPSGVTADHITLVQPQGGPSDRRVTRVRLRINGGPPIDVRLGDLSMTPQGQEVSFAATTVEDLDIELAEVSIPPFDPAIANAVGFAEVGLGDVTVLERVRVPTDLLDRADGGAGHRVDLVFTRLRYEPGERGRLDQERSLQRVFDLPVARRFGIGGTVRVDPNATDARLDAVLGTDLAGAKVQASSHLAGDLGSRASRALDGDAATAWQTAFGPQDGQTLTVTLPRPTIVAGLVANLVDDDRHSLPGTLTLRADGEVVGTVSVPTSDAPGSIAVTLPDPGGPVRQLELVVGKVQERTPVPGDENPFEVLPIALSELAGGGLPRVAERPAVQASCRPLLTVDGQDVLVRAVGAPADARRGLTLEACGGPLELAAGEHTIASTVGVDVGIDLDRLVLSSDADGGPATVAARGDGGTQADAHVSVDDDRRGTDYDLTVTSNGQPFWLVLGQSDNRGWSLDVDGATVGERRIVDGYANGWLITPAQPGELSVSVTWEPQRVVWVALVLSTLAVAGCLAIVVLGVRRRARSEVAAAPAPTLVLSPPGRRPLTPGAPGLAVAVGVVALLVTTPLAAVAATVAVVLGLLVPRATWAWLVAAPAGVIAAHGLDRPALAWLALVLVGVDVAVEWWTGRTLRTRQPPGGRRPALGGGGHPPRPPWRSRAAG